MRTDIPGVEGAGTMTPCTGFFLFGGLQFAKHPGRNCRVGNFLYVLVFVSLVPVFGMDVGSYYSSSLPRIYLSFKAQLHVTELIGLAEHRLPH